MTDVPTPQMRPARPYFSSGPCAKPPGWDASRIATESLGRSHRAKIGKTRLAFCIDLMREMLQLPETHRIGIVPASDTGAVEIVGDPAHPERLYAALWQVRRHPWLDYFQPTEGPGSAV